MLATRLLKRLELSTDSASPVTLSAASGLCWLRDTLYVVADDALHLAIFRLSQDAPGQSLPLLPGELPLEHKARKAAKPDFEVLTHWDACPGSPGGALLALGSGSKPNRSTGVLIALDANFQPVNAPVAFDLAPLYELLGTRIASLNIEGAVVHPDEWWLFQRGNSAQGENALIRLPLATLQQCIAHQAEAISPASIQIFPMALGLRDNVALSFTDATRLPDGRVIFAAAAEATDNPYDDGACAGSALGCISPTGDLLWTKPLAGRDKVEGVSVHMDTGSATCLLVTDADDATVAAKLLQTQIAL